MISEPHQPGSELGELQQALWRRQFEALRDGDRFFYLNDPVLEEIRSTFGISYEHTLAELILLDAGGHPGQTNVFYAPATAGLAQPAARARERTARRAARARRRAARAESRAARRAAARASKG